MSQEIMKMGNWTYSERRRLRRPREEGIAPLSELLDKSLRKIKKYQLFNQPNWSNNQMVK